ncbi:hypothetical protein Bpfe_013147 [Biomphalaria pfeifferi]|uniref:Uncharacterized protein n=1 Tax=Biomphalaria pfeifferi TaxID=112525 RepID=A0AAD8BMK5_BIOPF|nr:hypothetical protein Bpfe_013147 [Biomphalaria pfeifferi]
MARLAVLVIFVCFMVMVNSQLGGQGPMNPLMYMMMMKQMDMNPFFMYLMMMLNQQQPADPGAQPAM